MRTDSTVPAAKQTLASTMYGQLRNEILTGGIVPDSKLNIRALCDRFSVGLSPLREALSRLSAEGLVRQTDNRGFSVMPVSGAELLDLTMARSWINEVGLRQSIARGGAEWEEGLLLAYHRLVRTPRHVADADGDRNPAWEEAHRVFHLRLVDGCGSAWLASTCDRLFEAAERYRHVARLVGVSRGNLEDEHEAIMRAAVDRKADEAVALLTQHFDRTAELVTRVLGSSGAPQPLRAKRRPI